MELKPIRYGKWRCRQCGHLQHGPEGRRCWECLSYDLEPVEDGVRHIFIGGKEES